MQTKTYQCLRWPRLRLGKVAFLDGIYSTADEDVQAMIEAHDAFGVHIHSTTEEVAAEPEAEPEEEPKRGPGRPPKAGGARQGATSSIDL